MPIQLSFPELTPLIPLTEPANASAVHLWHFPDISARDRQLHARAFGRAGEALCDSLLLRHGLLPLVPPDHLAYDRLVICGNSQARLQIKTVAVPTNGAWSFTMKRGYQGSAIGTRRYEPDDFDIAALVCLSANVVFFTSQSGPWFRLTDHDVARAASNPRESLEQALAEIGISPVPTAPVAFASAL